MNNSKIFIVTNKYMPDLDDDVYSYIYVSNKSCAPTSAYRDDVGDNISDKNAKYDELTAIYWVYKHLDDFKELDYIGFEQYRRMFAFQGFEHRCFVASKIKNSLVNLSFDAIENYFSEYDLIVPCPSNVKSVFSHYSKAHNRYDLPLLLDIIKRKFPQYYKAAKEYFEGDKSYFYNAFIFRKSIFIQYCQFIFPLVNEFVKEAKDFPERYYFTERLTGAFIHYLISNNYNALEVPILVVKKRNFKAALKKTKDLFKDKHNASFIFKLKPLILYFMPNRLEQYLRRKICK